MLTYEQQKLRDKGFKQKFSDKLNEIKQVKEKNAFLTYVANRSLFDELHDIYQKNIDEYNQFYESNYKAFIELENKFSHSKNNIHKARIPEIAKLLNQIENDLQVEDYAINRNSKANIAKANNQIDVFIAEFTKWQGELETFKTCIEENKNSVWLEEIEKWQSRYEKYKTDIFGNELPLSQIKLETDIINEQKGIKDSEIAKLKAKITAKSKYFKEFAKFETKSAYRKDFEKFQSEILTDISNRITKKLRIIGAVIVILIVAFFVVSMIVEKQRVIERKERIANNAGTFTDARDGKTYLTIKIGNQTWMAENLAYKAGSGCWAYDNDESNVVKYGYLYDWETAKKVCPAGWHLPSDDEWKTLEKYLGMSESDANNIGWRRTIGKQLKAKSGWNKSGNGSDDYGFAAFPGGCRNYFDGSFYDASEGGDWWSSTPDGSEGAWIRGLDYFDGRVDRLGDRTFGYSVRCLKD